MSDPDPDAIPASADADSIPVVKLGDQYDRSIVGATIRGRIVYSLKKLVFLESACRGISEAEARELIHKEIVQITHLHGTDAPEFLDDELVEEPRIITPGHNGFRHVR